jgi:hypothetical protein
MENGMAYGEGQTAQAPTPVTSLVSDSGRIVERLQQIHGHLIDLGNKLHGSRPRDAIAAAPNKIEPEPTVRRNLDKAESWLSDIENELQGIAARS